MRFLKIFYNYTNIIKIKLEYWTKHNNIFGNILNQVLCNTFAFTYQKIQICLKLTSKKYQFTTVNHQYINFYIYVYLLCLFRKSIKNINFKL